MRRGCRLAALLLLFVLGLCRPAHAIGFFSSSPGPLGKGHAHVDGPNNCNRCHVEGKRDLSQQKCLDCHKAVAERITARRGVHATPKAAGRPCELCHKDHKGLDYDMYGWATFGGQQKFNHDISDYPLTGRHSVTECKQCHNHKTVTGRPTFLAAPTTCVGCHRSPHGEMHAPLDQCERCHDTRSWRALDPMKFDHQRDARFPLETKHIGVPCGSCHPKGLFRLSSWGADCTPCHKNVHGESLFGQKRCVGCHSARAEWTAVDFDHNHKTRFALDGPHKKPCVSCHLPADRKAPSRKCDACHKDAHAGRFSGFGECTACHLSSTWGPELRFDHDRQTRFTLTGRHSLVECRACHRGKGPADYENFQSLLQVTGPPRSRRAQPDRQPERQSDRQPERQSDRQPDRQSDRHVDCLGCHAHKDAHKRQFTSEQCPTCHKAGVKVPLKGVSLDKLRVIGHGPGKPFQLVDGHQIKSVEDCRRCHPSDQYQGRPLQCGPECHADKLHKGSLGQNCLQCHEGARWPATKFDHDKSDYPLVGKHRDASCEGCHPARQYKPRPRLCGDGECHLKDDAHERSLGTRCDSCHSPTGSVTFDHNDPKATGRWRLIGSHQRVRCEGCHPTMRYKPAPQQCEGCHADPVAHKGELGVRCAGCHEEAGWGKIHTGHDVFPVKFGGAHDRSRCAECHQQGRLLQGLAQLCMSCHQRDDIHHNTLGPRCNECHTQQTFAAARFNHDRVGCTLRGVHRVLPCADCHKGGNYAGLSAQCVACHRDDAVRAARTTPANSFHLSQVACGLCHNVNSFRPALGSALPGKVSAAGGSDSVCR